MPSIHVHFLPRLVQPDDLAGATVAVIDVLRATTTMTTALASGADCVIPCREVDEARRIAASLPSGSALLGGERGGLRIDGFDLGNSPGEYTPDRVARRNIVFTTTNGTRALVHCGRAERVWLAGFVNLQAVVNRLRDVDRAHLLCAGTDDQITREDVLAAGAIVHRLSMPDDPAAAGPWSRFERNDQAQLALDTWQATLPPAELPFDEARSTWLARALAASRGGRNLQAIGLARDIADCAAIDRFDIVPRFEAATGRVCAR